MRPKSETPRVMLIITALSLTMSLIIMTTYIAIGEHAYYKPFGLTFSLGTPYIFEKLSTNSFLLSLTKNGHYYVYLVRIMPTVPPKLVIAVNITVPSSPCCISVDNKRDPTSIAIVYGSNVLVYDISTGLENQFALQGNPLKIYPNGERSFLILTDRALFSIRFYKNSWFEERILVGNMLQERREGRTILDLIPVYSKGANYSYFGIAEETAAYTARAKILALWNNRSLITKGLLIGVIEEKSITTPPTPITNGSAIISLVPGSFNLSLYLKIGALCVKGPRLQINISANEFIQIGPIIFSNKSITICPQPLEARYLVLLGPGYPPREKVLPKTSSQIIGDTKLLLSYIDNNYLYIWINGVNSNTFSRNQYIAVLVYQLEPLQPETSLWRFYNGITASSISISMDYKVVSIAARGNIYIALKKNNTYVLTWSLPFKGSIKSMSILKYQKGYLLLVTGNNNIELTYITDDNPPKIITLSELNTPWINLYSAKYGYLSLKDNLYAVFTLSKGILVMSHLEDIVRNAIIHGKELNNIYDYIVGYIRLIAYNQDGELVKHYEVYAKLLYNNKTLLNITTLSTNGSTRIPCISYGVVQARIDPLNKDLYKPLNVIIRCNETRINYDDINITLPYVKHNLIIRVLDSYSNTPPLGELRIRILDVNRNKTISTIYPEGKQYIEVRSLLPGKYIIYILDPYNALYREKTVNITLVKDMNITIKINRRPAIVTLRLVPRPSQAAKKLSILDKLNITVITNNGERIFNTIVSAPLRAPLDVSFTTLYRGAAKVKITDIPLPGHGKFYRDSEIPILIGTRTVNNLYFIELRQLEHPLIVYVKTPDNATIRYILKIYPINSTKPVKIISSSVPSYTVFLPIGQYCFIVLPQNEYLGFKLYTPLKKCYKVNGLPSENIVLSLNKARILTNLTIIDPLSRGGVLLDNLTINLDGKDVMLVQKGKPKRITLPLLVNGSTITIKSSNNVYKAFSKKIMPRNKLIVLKLPRISFKYTLTVLSTKGKTLAGSIVTIEGLDNILHLRYTTDEKGTISITLPYGSYQVCVAMIGYITKCYTLSIHASATDVVTLKPTLATLIRSYIIPITIVIVGILLVVVTRAYFKKVLERLSEEEF